VARTMSAAVDEAVSSARAAMEATVGSPSFASAAHCARLPLHKRDQVSNHGQRSDLVAFALHPAKSRAPVGLANRPQRYSLEALPLAASVVPGGRRVRATHSAPPGSRATRGHIVTAPALLRPRPETARVRDSTIPVLLPGQRPRRQPLPVLLDSAVGAIECPRLRRQSLSVLLDSTVRAIECPTPETQLQPHDAPSRAPLQPVNSIELPHAVQSRAPPSQPIDIDINTSEVPSCKAKQCLPLAKPIDPQVMDYLVYEMAQRREVLELYTMYTKQERYTSFGKLFEAHPSAQSTFEGVLRLRYPRASRSDIAAMVAIVAQVAAKREWAKTMREVEELFGCMDDNGDGGIDLSEFLAACEGVPSLPKRGTLRKLFQSADADGSGVLDKDEFSHLAATHDVRPCIAAVVQACKKEHDLWEQLSTNWLLTKGGMLGRGTGAA